jgi:signal transduction histidine kinase
VALALLLFAYDKASRTVAGGGGEQVLRTELAHVGRLSVVGEMGTKIAHELNQPLGAIQGYLAGSVRRLGQREADPEEVVGALEQAMRETERASAIIRGLREFARRSEGRWSTVDIHELVRRSSRSSPSSCARAGSSRSSSSPRVSTVYADRIQIGQVLVNLIRNSIEAMASTPVDERRLIVKTSRISDRMTESKSSTPGADSRRPPPEPVPALPHDEAEGHGDRPGDQPDDRRGPRRHDPCGAAPRARCGVPVPAALPIDGGNH